MATSISDDHAFLIPMLGCSFIDHLHQSAVATPGSAYREYAVRPHKTQYPKPCSNKHGVNVAAMTYQEMQMNQEISSSLVIMLAPRPCSRIDANLLFVEVRATENA